MKKSISPLLFFLLALFGSNLPAASQTRYNFNGLWRTNDDVLIQIKDSGSTIIAKYLNPGDCSDGHNCVLGGGGDYYVTGTVSPDNKMNLTMLRCTHKKAMRDDGLSALWTAPCKVTSVTDKTITGSSRVEWYLNDYQDGKEVNFRREPSKDFDDPFTLSRTKCKEELEELAAEIDQKAASLKEQATAIEDVSKSFHDAIQNYRAEVDEQVKEEVFQGVVPPPVKVATVAYSGEPADHIESWNDLVKDLAESGGKIGLKTATWVISIADMLIDLANINAKGIVTINETGQINTELGNMRGRRNESFQSWANSMLEYQKLSELCAGEIPKEQQPKPTGSIVVDKQIDDERRAAEEAKRIQSSIGADIESARSAIETTIASIENLQQFLEPYKTADRNKTLKVIMTAAGVTKFQNGLIEIGNNWIKVLRLVESIDGKMKKLSTGAGPKVG